MGLLPANGRRIIHRPLRGRPRGVNLGAARVGADPQLFGRHLATVARQQPVDVMGSPGIPVPAANAILSSHGLSLVIGY